MADNWEDQQIALERHAFGTLLNKGWEPHQAAGIVENLVRESNMNHQAVGDGGNAYGLAQWNGPRKQSLMRYAATKGEKQPSFETQLDYLHDELTKGTEKQAGLALYQTKDPYEASRVVLQKYERPAQPYVDKRLNQSKQSPIIKRLYDWMGTATADAAEIPKIESMSDEELEEIAYGDHQSVESMSDDELKDIAYGGTTTPHDEVIKTAIPDNAPDWGKAHPELYWKVVDTVNGLEGVGDMGAMLAGGKLGATAGTAGGLVGGGAAAPVAGLIGGVAGAGLGYALKKQGTDRLREYLGMQPPSTGLQAAGKAVTDTAVGATMEMAGQGVGKIAGDTLGFLKATYPLSSEAIEKRAGKIIQDNADPTSLMAQKSDSMPQNSDYYRNYQTAENVEREIPGLSFSAGAKTDDPGLIKLQRGLESHPGDAAYILKQKQASNQQAIREYLKAKFPGIENVDEVANELMKQREQVSGQLPGKQQLLDDIRSSMKVADPQQVGMDIVDTIGKVKAPIKEAEEALWAEVPDYPLPMSNTLKTVNELAAQPSVARDDILAFRKIIKQTPSTVTGLQSIERQLGSEINQFKRAGKFEQARSMSILKDAVKRDFQAMSDAAEAGDVALVNDRIVYPSQLSSELEAVVSRIEQESAKLQSTPNQEAIIEALKAKKIPSMRQNMESDNGFTNRIVEAYKRAYPGQEIPMVGGGNSEVISQLQGRKDALESALQNLQPAEDVAAKYQTAKKFTKENIIDKFRTGATKDILRTGDEFSGLDMPHEKIPSRFFTTSGADDLIRAIGSEEASSMMESYASKQLLEKAMNPMTQELNAKTLNRWISRNKPVLDRYGLTQKYSTLASAQESVDALIKKEADLSKGIAAKFLATDPEKQFVPDPTEALRTIFKGTSNPTKVMMELVKKVENNPRALAGLQNAFKDFMVDQAETTAQTIARDSVISPASIIKSAKKYDSAMKFLYKNDPEKLKALQTVRDAFEISSRSGRPVGSGSDTAEKMSIHGSVINGVFKHLPLIKHVYSVLGLIGKTTEWASRNATQNLTARLLYDPEAALMAVNLANGKISKERAKSMIIKYLTEAELVRETNN